MVKEILIIRLSSIGDIIHCTPVASSLKNAWQDCKITWLVGEVSADLLKYNPDIDEIIIWSREKFEKYLREFNFVQAFMLWYDLREKLRRKAFYAVLDIHGLFLTGMITRLAKAERYIGMKGARELNPFFMTEVGDSIGSHITEKYLGILKCLGIEVFDSKMSLFISIEARKFAAEFLQQHVIGTTEKIIVLVLGTTWPSKNWPPTHFIALIKLLYKDFRIIICGGRGELGIGKEVEASVDVSVINAIGVTSLLEMAAIIEQAVVIVAGDTGPLHMAGALNIPTVGLFGPTDPMMYAPRGGNNISLSSNFSCIHCHKRRCLRGKECMSSISPEDVAQRVYDVLKIQ